MFLLKKVFQVRDKAAQKVGRMSHDEEKPFLEHLEDLRVMFMKVIITVMISMVGCFVFNKELMDIIRYPVKLAGLAEGDPFLLPEAIPKKRWSDAEKIVQAARDAPPAFRDHYIAAAIGDDKELGELVEAYGIFQMAATLAGPQREQFVADASAGKSGILEKVQTLLRSNPNADPRGERSLIRMSTLKPAESFTLSIKLALYAGLVICFPFLLYFIGEFVLPGLHSHEKRLLFPSLVVGFGLFLFGVLFCYYVVTPRALAFFHNFGDQLGMESDWRIGYYVGFVTQLILLFGLSFELPVVIMALVKLEILSYEMMRNSRSYAIVIIFFIAALITPTVDVLTLFLLAGPMVILYEICIWLAYFLNRKERLREEQERAEREARRAKLAADREARALAAATEDDDPHDHFHDDHPPHDDHGHHDHHHDDPYHHHQDPHHHGGSEHGSAEEPIHDDPYHHDPHPAPDEDPYHYYHDPDRDEAENAAGGSEPDPFHGGGDPNAHYMGELRSRTDAPGPAGDDAEAESDAADPSPTPDATHGETAPRQAADAPEDPTPAEDGDATGTGPDPERDEYHRGRGND